MALPIPWQHASPPCRSSTRTSGDGKGLGAWELCCIASAPYTLRCRSVDRPHQDRTPIWHGEPQLVIPRLGINVHVKHQSVLQNLLISVRIEGLVDFLGAIGQHLADRRIDRHIHSHIQTLGARSILSRKGVGINQESYSDFVLYRIGGRWLHLCAESNQG